MFKTLLKTLFPFCLLVVIWQIVVWMFNIPHYLLATPKSVLTQLWDQQQLLLIHTKVTLIEILLGLFFGFALGLISALILSSSKQLRALLLPIFVLSQAIPVFAIAPLLVLWFGYGMTSKIIMAILIIYFPVTAACFDGLRNTPKQWLELAQTMQIPPLKCLFKVKLPASLPSLASGLRIATSIAPIGAIVGEWVGSSSGLGYLMLQANARMQVDLMFSALFILMLMALTLYFFVDFTLKRLIPWASHLQ